MPLSPAKVGDHAIVVYVDGWHLDLGCLKQEGHLKGKIGRWAVDMIKVGTNCI